MPAYKEAQQLISQWSEKILQFASDKYQQGKLEEAKAIAKSVSEVSSLSQKVATTIEIWDKEWQQNQEHLQTAQEKLDKNRWQEAIVAAKKISENEHLQKQSEEIIQKAEAKIAASKASSRQVSKSNSQKINRVKVNPPVGNTFIPEHKRKFNPMYNTDGDWVKKRLGR